MTTAIEPSAVSPAPRRESVSPVPLVARLARMFAARRVRACLWKGAPAAAPFPAPGDDVDLLVERSDLPAAIEILSRLGFEPAVPPPTRQIPGVMSWLGSDRASGRVIHLHLALCLTIGRPWGRWFRLPLARPVLDSVIPGEPFPVPAPEPALVLLVLRMTLRYSLRDLVRRGDPGWLSAIQPELERLSRSADRGAVGRLLAERLPDLDLAVLSRFAAVLRPGRSALARLAARFALERRLGAHGGRPERWAGVRRVTDRARSLVGRGRPPEKRLSGGGLLAALVGADGAGKSTVAAAIRRWLESEVETVHAHFGRPPRSLATIAAGVGYKAARLLHRLVHRPATARLLDHAELIRAVGTARDRHRLYRRTWQSVAAGRIAICERYPTAEGYPLVGPSLAQGRAVLARGRLAERLRALESAYYARMTRPDLVILLAVDPETAVGRKPEEPEAYVRRRAQITRDTVWPEESTRIVDANRPLPEVLASVRDLMWEAI